MLTLAIMVPLPVLASLDTLALIHGKTGDDIGDLVGNSESKETKITTAATQPSKPRKEVSCSGSPSESVSRPYYHAWKITLRDTTYYIVSDMRFPSGDISKNNGDEYLF